jgi:hypothetical protein
MHPGDESEAKKDLCWDIKHGFARYDNITTAREARGITWRRSDGTLLAIYSNVAPNGIQCRRVPEATTERSNYTIEELLDPPPQGELVLVLLPEVRLALDAKAETEKLREHPWAVRANQALDTCKNRDLHAARVMQPSPGDNGTGHDMCSRWYMAAAWKHIDKNTAL